MNKNVKVILWILVALLLILVSIIVAVPKIISTEKGKELALRCINRYIDGKLSVEKIQLNWFSGQYIEKLYLIDHASNEIFSFDRFLTEETLFSALFGRYHVGETKLMSPHLYLEENKEGDLNVSKIFKMKKKEKVRKRTLSLPKFKGSISIQNGQMKLSSSKVLSPVLLSDINLEAKDSFSKFHINAKTSQGPNDGAILIYGQCCKNIQVIASVNNFPVSMIDQLKGSKLYETAIGNTLNMNLELNKKENSLILETTVNSPNLEGHFKGSTQNETFNLDQGHILFTVTPSFFQELFHSKEWHLANRPELVIDIEKLVLPLELKTFDFRKIPLLGKMTLQRAEMTHTDLGILSLNDFKADFTTHANPEKNYVDLHYSATVQGKGAPTELGGNIQFYSNQSITFFNSFKSLPTNVLELILSIDSPLLHKILGEQFSLELMGKYDQSLDVNLSLATSTFDIHGTIKGDTLEDLKTTLDGKIFIPVRYRPYLGDEPPLVHIEADLSLHEKTLVVPYGKIEAKNPHFSVNISGHAGEKEKGFDYKDVEITGVGRIHHLPIASYLDYHGQFFFKFDGKQNDIIADAILTSLSGTDETLTMNFKAKDVIVQNELEIHSGEIDFLTKFKNFPVAFFDTFYNLKNPLEPYIGRSLDIDTHVYKKGGKDEIITGDFDFEGKGFFLNLSLLMNGGVSINQAKPALLHWEMTPERYQFLTKFIDTNKQIEYVLDHSSSFDLVVEKFSCPKLPITNLEQFICDGGLIGKITAEPIVFKDSQTSKTLILKNTTGQILANDVSKNITFDFSSEIVSSYVPPDVKTGFSVKLNTLNLLTDKGEFNKEHFTINCQIDFDQIPVPQLTALLPLKPDIKQAIQALLGPLVNGRIYGEISQLAGPLTIDIKASNFKGIFPLQFTSESLTLQKNVEAELTLTEEINAVILKAVTPILISGAWSDHPLKLYIDAQGFYIPLRPFLFQNVRIEKGVLDLGKIRVKNGGEILSLMKFLKAKDVSSEGIMEAWFTPIFFSLKDGVASYKRFDALLAGNVHIAMWGGVDIINDRVGMTLGISPATLQRNFDIMGMSNKDMFQVKMRGSTSKLDLDWSSAYTRIGLILARTGGGHIGYIIGGILEGLLGLLGEESTPDPTTSPFPWEKSQKNIPPTEGMPEEVSLKDEPNAGLRKILNFLIP